MPSAGRPWAQCGHFPCLHSQLPKELGAITLTKLRQHEGDTLPEGTESTEFMPPGSAYEGPAVRQRPSELLCCPTQALARASLQKPPTCTNAPVPQQPPWVSYSVLGPAHRAAGLRAAPLEN